MNDDTASPAAPELVADYLCDLLRSMSGLAAATGLPRSAKALRHALATVNEERLGVAGTAQDPARAASDR
ncbi:MAG: hypothetical protein ACK4NO_06220 [Glycocaulis sp.]